jgi:serine/threonine protein kinase
MTSKEYVVKKFKKKFTTKKQAFDQREVQILLKFNEMAKRGVHCPYVLSAERIEYENRKLYIIFEKMEMNLQEYIKKKRKSGGYTKDRPDIDQIMKQLMIGIQYLHDDMGIMHRDLKPENIMIN